jgi:hypothetical protein
MNEDNVRRRGRPRLPTDQGKRYPIAIRTTKELKERLERASEASGRSLAQELEFRLERSFGVQDITDAVRPLTAQIGELALLIIGLHDRVGAHETELMKTVLNPRSAGEIRIKETTGSRDDEGSRRRRVAGEGAERVRRRERWADEAGT